MLSNTDKKNPGRGPGVAVLGIALGLFGGLLAAGGAWLAALGGSWYYLLAGIASLLSAWTVWHRRPSAAGWFGLLFVGTLLWTIWESGLNYWRWVPRFDVVLVLAIGFALVLPQLVPTVSRRLARAVAAVLGGSLIAALALAFVPYHVTPPTGPIAEDQTAFDTDTGGGDASRISGSDWYAYGGSLAAQRYSTATQITPDNVKQLKLAWSYQTGDRPSGRWGTENTPIKVGDNLYVCSATNKVIALDPSTGKEKWQFDPEIDPLSLPYTPACRGLAYFDDHTNSHAAANPGQGQQQAGGGCARRIIMGTLDARVIAIDADNGQRCADFGANGEVSITDDMGEVYQGYVAITSPPAVIRDTIVVGHQVIDGQRAFGPPGVTKAYDVRTGRLKWAWDAASPYDATPRHGPDAYKRGSPNVWTSFTGDDKLGLVYLPVANASGDYWSSLRTPEENKFSVSLAALDIETGLPKWNFQATRQDVWDYDLGSPPTLVDYPGQDSQPVPAIVLPTKTGDVYVLNRLTGEPLFGVEERPVPQGGLEPESRAATQPASLFANLRKPDLAPQDMWGLTPIDQLYCRIQYQQAEYRGMYTPPVEGAIIQYPGYNGGSDWGGMSIDPSRGLLIANYNDMPNYTTLIPRAKADELGWKAKDAITTDPDAKGKGEGASDPQEGLPYAVDVNAGWRVPFTGMLCKQPPYGWVRAIDLKSGKTVWDRPLGTARQNGPFGIRTGLSINIGTPNNGGSAVTKSGLVFIAAATDDLLRAIDSRTGETLWSVPLPAGGQANPMIYEQGGRQYVVIGATGHHFMETKMGDYVLAYALP